MSGREFITSPVVTSGKDTPCILVGMSSLQREHLLMLQWLHQTQQNGSSSPCLFIEIAKITAANRSWGRATHSNYPGLL